MVDHPVGFTAILDGTINLSAGEKVPYSIIVTNVGNGYNTDRSEFICPNSGIYVFYVNIYAYIETTCRLDIMKNGVQTNRAHSSHLGFDTGTTMAVLELEEGDIVSSVISDNECQVYGDDKLTSFSGFRIH